MGDFGVALLFICTLVVTAIVGSYALGYAGITLLNVVQETAAGNEDLSWPDDALPDKIGRAFYFGVLLICILTPGGILARMLKNDLFPDDNGLRLVAVSVPVLWLCLPIGLLSSQSGTSPWLFFRPVIVVRMLRLLPTTVIFYLTSAALAGVAGYAWYLAIFSPWSGLLVLLAAPLSGWLWLLYARLLGRFAAMIGLLGPLSGDPLPKAMAPLNKARKSKVRPVQSHDPWATPEETGEEQPKPVIAEGEVVEPYLLGGENKVSYPEKHHLAGKVRESRADKGERLARKRRQTQRSRAVAPVEGIGILFRGLATFPVQGKTPAALAALSFGFGALGGAVYALITMGRG